MKILYIFLIIFSFYKKKKNNIYLQEHSYFCSSVYSCNKIDNLFVSEHAVFCTRWRYNCMNSCLTDGCRIGASQTFFIQFFHVLNIYNATTPFCICIGWKKKPSTYGVQHVYGLSHGKLWNPFKSSQNININYRNSTCRYQLWLTNHKSARKKPKCVYILSIVM